MYTVLWLRWHGYTVLWVYYAWHYGRTIVASLFWLWCVVCFLRLHYGVLRLCHINFFVPYCISLYFLDLLCNSQMYIACYAGRINIYFIIFLCLSLSYLCIMYTITCELVDLLLRLSNNNHLQLQLYPQSHSPTWCTCTI